VLITAAVVPGPPAFVVELMGSAAHELDDLREAADRVVARVLSDLLTASAGARSSGSTSGPGSTSGSGSTSGPGPGSGSGSGSAQLVVVGPGSDRELDATGPVSFAGFGRQVVVPALVEGSHGEAELPTPIMVARYLASRDIAAHPEHAQLWASARWITTSGADAAALGKQLSADGTDVGLILVADGAACHGPKAPRAQDSRAQAYDDEVRAALATGQPGPLARIEEGLGNELGATGQQVWPLLVAAAGAEDRAGAGWTGEVLWAGAPYGVGWTVASWRRSATEDSLTRS
jgi:hypothetical protein